MCPPSQWKKSIAAIVLAMLLASQTKTSAFAFGQVNSLRMPQESGEVQTGSQNKPISDQVNISPVSDATPGVGIPLFPTESLDAFQSSLNQPAVPEAKTTAATTPSTLGELKKTKLVDVVGQVAKATFIVISLCVACLFALRKFKAERFFLKDGGTGASQSNSILVLDSTKLPGNKRLELVEAHGSRLAILSGAGHPPVMLLLSDDPKPSGFTELMQAQASKESMHSKAEQRSDSSSQSAASFSNSRSVARERFPRISL